MGLAEPLSVWLQPYANQLNIPHLPAHLPTILRSLLMWVSLQLLSSGISPRLFPKVFANMNKRTRTNWDVHFVSLCHALVITPLAARAWWSIRQAGDAHPLISDRMYGYDYHVGQIYAIALGYFIWDSVISLMYEGPGFIAHGLVAFTAFTLVYYPVFMYDGLTFLLWELSTPFLNFHWYFDKLGMTGSVWQLINAAFLLGAYVGARLTFGVYNSFQWFQFVLFPTVPHPNPVPTYIVAFYMTGNVALNCLNFFWFRAMIGAVQKRFTVKPNDKSNGIQLDPIKIVKGEQTIQVGVRGTNDEKFERQAGVIKNLKNE